MARSRKYGEDLTYSEWHRHALPEQYGRIGHRIDMADRDWTEYCHYCKTPLALIEEVSDRGQDLLDKGVSVTRNLAKAAKLQDAYLLGVRTDRPEEVDREIKALHDRIRQLEAQWPILEFTVRDLLAPGRTLHKVTVNDWLSKLLIIHRKHHQTCSRAREWPVNGDKLLDAMHEHPLCDLHLFDVLGSLEVQR